MTLCFDLETTGLDPDTARIVELAAVDEEDDPTAPAYHRRFHPGGPIPEAASRVHGITDDDVAGAPRFGEEAGAVQRLFRGRTLCGYNLRSFDTPLLDAELRRSDRPGLDLEAVREIDLYRIWTMLEPAGGRGRRTLEAAVERYLGRRHPGAHGAADDARVLPELHDAMRDEHGLDREEMLELSAPPSEVDRAGKLQRLEGEVVFAFGKHAGDPVLEHPGYVDWMLDADFPGETKRILRRLRGA